MHLQRRSTRKLQSKLALTYGGKNECEFLHFWQRATLASSRGVEREGSELTRILPRTKPATVFGAVLSDNRETKADRDEKKKSRRGLETGVCVCVCVCALRQ